MSPDWSSLHFREDLQTLSDEVLESLGEIFDAKLPTPNFSDKQGWLYALPDTLVKEEDLTSLKSEGLFFIGDSYVGGRVHLAIQSGLELAEQISSNFDSN